MKLNNSQYDTIMRMYDTRQSHARAVQNSRIEEINARIPEYDELRKETATVSAEAARAAVMGPPSTKKKVFCSQRQDTRRIILSFTMSVRSARIQAL